MDLAEKIDASIMALKDPEKRVFDFKKEVELLSELKKFVNEHSNFKNFADDYKTKVENLNKIPSALRVEKSELETEYNEITGELNKFSKFMQNEISTKMKLLEYPENDIEKISKIKEFSELCSIREKVSREFDVKFKIQYTVKDTPEKKIIDFSIYKV